MTGKDDDCEEVKDVFVYVLLKIHKGIDVKKATSHTHKIHRMKVIKWKIETLK